jgi:hypothetical protein
MGERLPPGDDPELCADAFLKKDTERWEEDGYEHLEKIGGAGG